MADDFVQVAPDSTGKKIDNTTETTGAGSVERQRVSVAAAGSNNQLAIDSNGNIGISAGTVSANTITAGTLGALSATTITSIPSITVVAMNAGTVTSSTITAALPAGTNVIGHVIVDSLTAGTVGANTVTAGTVNVNASTISALGASSVGAVVKGTQAVNAFPTQALHDSGRTYISLYANLIAGVTSEGMVTMTVSKQGTTSSTASYTVTSGKTLRLLSFHGSVHNTGTTANRVYGRLRHGVGGAASTTSPIIGMILAASQAALTTSGGADDHEFAEGIEIAGGDQVGMSQLCTVTTAGIVSLIATGYEY